MNNRQKKLGPWLVGGMCLCLGAIAIVLLLDSDDEITTTESSVGSTVSASDSVAQRADGAAGSTLASGEPAPSSTTGASAGSEPDTIRRVVNPLPGVSVGCPGCTYDHTTYGSQQALPSPLPGTEGLAALETNYGQEFGLTIDDQWLTDNQSQPWLTNEGGRWVIDGVKAEGFCLHIAAEKVTIRNSFIDCPTKTQNDSWGWVGPGNQSAAIHINGEDAVIERNTITCSGYDNKICSRSIWGRKGAVIRRNDLSYSRGGITVVTDNIVEENYIHHYSFGQDGGQDQVGNNPGITHNNGINLQGYPGGRIRGNYIDGRYGRVSKTDGANQYFKNYYNGSGIPNPGQFINGFIIGYYGVEGVSDDVEITRNYFVGGQRTVGCNPERFAIICRGINDNLIESGSWILSETAPLHMFSGGQTEILGSCNRYVEGGLNGTIGEFLDADDIDRGTLDNSNCAAV